MTAKILTCTCCGTEIRAPQFHDGKPYGWTCIKKVRPDAKQSKLKFYPVEVLSAAPSFILPNTQGKPWDIVFSFKGSRFSARVHEAHRIEQDGAMFLSEYVFKTVKPARKT